MSSLRSAVVVVGFGFPRLLPAYVELRNVLVDDGRHRNLVFFGDPHPEIHLLEPGRAERKARREPGGVVRERGATRFERAARLSERRREVLFPLKGRHSSSAVSGINTRCVCMCVPPF